MKSIVFTGGHHTSALVVARQLKKQGFAVIWYGHRYTMRGVKNLSLEYQQVRQAGIPFLDLLTGKIHQGGVTGWLRFIRGFFQAVRLLRRDRPALIVSFGGYLAVPVVLAGWWLGIPAVTHEQTVTAGMANRFLQHFVKKIFLTWPESARFFPARKSQVVGLPLRPEIINPAELSWFRRKKPLILITGGKQGAHIMNQTVFSALPLVLPDCNVLHQTGRTSTTDDWQQARKLQGELSQGYRAVDYLTDAQMGSALKQAACVVGRAGAHTVYELLVLGKPAVLVPLPFSFAQEQQRNAEKVVAAGLGEIIEQTELTPQRLVEAVAARVTAAGTKRTLPLDATQKMVQAIHQLLS